MAKTDALAAWDGAAVRKWLESRAVAARANQVTAERQGRDGQDECDVAAAEEMVCLFLKARASVDDQASLLSDLKAYLERDDFIWRGVYNDDRFDRHVRGYVRKLMRMAKSNSGFDKLSRYQ